MRRIAHLATANDAFTSGAHTRLWGISVGTLAASAVVTVYDGTSTSGTVVAIIDAAAAKDINFHGARFPAGLHVVLTGGNAKVSIVSE